MCFTLEQICLQKDAFSKFKKHFKNLRQEIFPEEQRPIPEPKDHQVLLRMESIGICGSDVHYLVEGRIGPFVVEKPMVIGHEASGTVVQVGKDVKNLKPGDRVAIEPGVGCRVCSFCKEGRYHLCPDMAFCATPPIDGNLTRFYVHDADFCFKLPDHVSLDEGVLMEPLAVGVHSCKRANVRFGDVVLVMGAGPIGLVTMMAAKAMAATAVFITDLADFRLKKAKELGADYVMKIRKDMQDKDVIAKIKETLGEDPNVTIDCTGAEQCIRIALQVTRTGGVVVLAGMDKFEVTLPLTSAIFREVDIRGIFRYNNDYPTAIEMVKNKKANVKALITHHFKMEDTVKAFQTARTGEGYPIKIIIHANPDWKP
ncbi:sorbitol dehydrogenase-like isoform X4 [Tenebrio molitor]|uniref:sorbitol dehydrogenase-like isoform X4 n=1 Tax=Tenebrio molitor TaxID=7067 RepID=UPI0036246D1F